MARSETVTLISLDRAAQILGIDAAHFNTITTTRRPENPSCDDLFFQYAWQRVGQAGRDDLAKALYEAEQQTARYLGFYPAPKWVSEEEHEITQPYDVALHNLSGLNSHNRPKSIESNFGYVIDVGVKAKTVIQAGAAVAYSDVDGDGYKETATVTVNTTITDTDEIRVYFPGKSGKDAWEIRPVSIAVNAGVATITFSRFLVPLPELWDRDPTAGDVWRTIDGDVDANFITTADVYRVYTDISNQATFYYEGICTDCNGTGCPSCNYTTNTACIRVRDSRLGLLSYAPATWDSATSSFIASTSCVSDPQKILVNYRAGFVDKTVEDWSYKAVDPAYERAIVYYAASLMERQLNLCGNAQNVFQQFNEDMALAADGRSWSIALKNLQNPLGTTRAAIKLWRMIEKDRLL